MISRREMLGRAGVGLGTVGLASVWASAAPARTSGGPLAPKLAHFPPRAKRIIHVYMNGGPSQVDTFDYKPALKTYQGQRPEITAKLKTENGTGGMMPSPFACHRRGEWGLPISELYGPRGR